MRTMLRLSRTDLHPMQVRSGICLVLAGMDHRLSHGAEGVGSDSASA